MRTNVLFTTVCLKKKQWKREKTFTFVRRHVLLLTATLSSPHVLFKHARVFCNPSPFFLLHSNTYIYLSSISPSLIPYISIRYPLYPRHCRSYKFIVWESIYRAFPQGGSSNKAKNPTGEDKVAILMSTTENMYVVYWECTEEALM